MDKLHPGPPMGKHLQVYLQVGCRWVWVPEGSYSAPGSGTGRGVPLPQVPGCARGCTMCDMGQWISEQEHIGHTRSQRAPC
jgi:hypothetical protein